MKVGIKIKIPVWDGSEACAGVGVELFYDDNRKTEYQNRIHHDKLIAMCNSCPRLNDCFTYAIHHEQYGFWAGMTEAQRNQYRKTHKIKLLRPEMYSECMPDVTRPKKEENTDDNFYNG
jgi:hypothetical protein